MDGDLGALIRQEITKFNILAMDKVWDNGFHQITTRSKAINTPSDLKRLKLRTAEPPPGFDVQCLWRLANQPQFQ